MFNYHMGRNTFFINKAIFIINNLLLIAKKFINLKKFIGIGGEGVD